MYHIEKKQPIAVFDSGVGGISVLRELKKLCQMKTLFISAIQKCTVWCENEGRSKKTYDCLCHRLV